MPQGNTKSYLVLDYKIFIAGKSLVPYNNPIIVSYKNEVNNIIRPHLNYFLKIEVRFSYLNLKTIQQMYNINSRAFTNSIFVMTAHKMYLKDTRSNEAQKNIKSN